MIRAVVFDMGGTLLRFARTGDGTWREWEERGLRSLYRYLVDQGHPLEGYEEAFVDALFHRLAEGWAQATGGQINMRAVDWIAATAEQHQLTLNEQTLMEAVRHYARPLREGVSATAGARAALEMLRDGGKRSGLISNTIWPAELHIEDLDELGLLPFLEEMLFSGDFGIWKPRPEIFLHMLERLEVAPAEAVFVGDNPREDIAAAQAVGMRAVWVGSDEFPLAGVQPDAIVRRLDELPAIVAQW
jgi:putative hydrolase of the HAD superfamily